MSVIGSQRTLRLSVALCGLKESERNETVVPRTESDCSCVRACACVFVPVSRCRRSLLLQPKKTLGVGAFRLSRPAAVQDYYVIRILLLLATIVGESGDRDRVV